MTQLSLVLSNFILLIYSKVLTTYFHPTSPPLFYILHPPPLLLSLSQAFYRAQATLELTTLQPQSPRAEITGIYHPQLSFGLFKTQLSLPSPLPLSHI